MRFLSAVLNIDRAVWLAGVAVLVALAGGGWLLSSVRTDAHNEAVTKIAAETTRTITQIEKSHDAIAEKSAADGDAAVDDSLRNGSFFLKPNATGRGGAAAAD